MHRSRLALAGRLLVVLLAVFVFGGLAAAAAQAEEAPSWYRESARLGAGETHFITAKAYSTSVTLTAAGRKVTCGSIKLKEGVIMGSSAGNPGTNDEAIEFSGGCTIEGDGTGCKIKEPVVTNNIRSELVESEKGEKRDLLMVFKPEKGPALATLHFEGSGCTIKETLVEGEVAGEVFTDPNDKELGEKVEGYGYHEAASWLINFPSTPITRVWLIKEGLGSEVKLKELAAFSEEAVLAGTALVSLANAKHEAEETYWGFTSEPESRQFSLKVNVSRLVGQGAKAEFTAKNISGLAGATVKEVFKSENREKQFEVGTLELANCRKAYAINEECKWSVAYIERIRQTAILTFFLEDTEKNFADKSIVAEP
jgi:hypothetical protein